MPRRTHSTPRASRRRGRPLVPVLVVLLAAFGGAVWFGVAGGGDGPAAELSRVEFLRAKGRFDEAEAVLRSLRRNWVSGDPERRRVVEAAAGDLERARTLLRAGRERLVRESARRTYAQLSRQLRRTEREGATAVEREVARLLRSRLYEILAAASAAGDAAPERTSRAPARGGVTEDEPAGRTAAGAPSSLRRESGAAESGGDLVAELVADADEMLEDGRFADALELLGQGLAGVPERQAGPLREKLAEARERTRSAMRELRARARALVVEKGHAAAIAFLRDRVDRFPANGSLATLRRELERLETEAAAARRERVEIPSAASRAGTAAEAAALLDRQRAAERAGDFVRARDLLLEGADRVRARDPALAKYLEDKARGLDLILNAVDAVRQGLAAAGGAVEVTLRNGAFADLVGVEGARARVRTATGERVVAWHELDGSALLDLAHALRMRPGSLLGLAVLAYRARENAAAEALLARAWRADPGLHDRIEEVIRRGRGDPAMLGGYELVKGAFVSRRALEVAKRAAQLRRDVERGLRGRPASWSSLRERLADVESPEELDAWISALKQVQEALARRLAEHPFKRKVWDRLAAERAALDRAREHAKELIYDEVRYFYPYRPPAVDPQKAKEYWPVQEEVDRRVEEVRKLWSSSRVRGKPPARLREDAARFRFLTDLLAENRERRPAMEERCAWVSTLPAEGVLTLQNFCLDAAERERLDLYERIERFNVAMKGSLTDGEWRQVRITNAYRRMFGHRPLAVNLKILAAARGHCEEMSRLGYFGHFSPTPGRRTPFDRMRLAGYPYGASENIALHDSAEGAHVAWLHSSGHHRNLLNPAHKEFAVGHVGRYWTQNFSRGEEFTRHPAW